MARRPQGMTAASLSEAMVGAAPVMEAPPVTEGRHFKPEMLKVAGLSAPASAHGVALRGIDFSVQGGEIFGIAGIGGNGQAELVEALIGVRPVTAGSVLFDGEDMPESPEARRERGLRYIPADRMGMGLFGELPLNVNIALPRLLGTQGGEAMVGDQRLDERPGAGGDFAIRGGGRADGYCRCGCSPAAMRRS